MRWFLMAIKARSRFWIFRVGAVAALIILVVILKNENQPRTYFIVDYARAQSAGDAGPNGSGFLWSDTAGWISMNCENDWDGDGRIDEIGERRCTGAGGAYGVRVEVNDTTFEGTLSGYAWSPNIGLVCFGAACGACTEGVSCETGQLTGESVRAAFDMDEARVVSATDAEGIVTSRSVAYIHGFARILAHSGEGGVDRGGWMRLNGATPGGTPIEVGAWVNEGLLNIAGSGWQQNADRTGVGWIFFGDAPPGNAREGVSETEAEEEVILVDRETECNDAPCCANESDDDHDKNYALDSIHDLNDRDEYDITGRDCTDYDCARTGETDYGCAISENVGGTTPELCFDEIDNDLDAYIWDDVGRRFVVNLNTDAGIDCGDEDCATAVYGGRRCSSTELCEDGFDNDGDTLVDCADSVDCASFVFCRRAECLCTVACPEDDPDGDLVRTTGTDSLPCDNCGTVSNASQINSDGDDEGGDACDPVAWLETREGSLYARGLFGTPPSTDHFTATYCILTSAGDATALGRVNSQSRSCSSLPGVAVSTLRIRESGDGNSVFILSDTGTNSVRARINLPPLRTGAPGVYDLSTLPPTEIASTLSALSSSRYYFPGDLEINEEIVLPAGHEGVTILVEGNLTFGPKAKLTYSTDRETLTNLTSVAWVVQGNISINPAVQDLAGTFLTTGSFSTGTNVSVADVSLTIRGLVVAREFNLQREYADLTRGSELIIYDGRAVLNPPPGLGDLVKALPTLRGVAPQ